MFKCCIVHFPTDEAARKAIYKEIASFRAAATVRYVQSLNLSDRQIEVLIAGVENELATTREKGA